MKEEIKNNSVKKCVLCNNDNIGEFITINNEKYHLCCIENLQSQLKAKEEVIKEASNRINKAIDEIDKLRSINGDFKGCKKLLKILSKGENK